MADGSEPQVLSAKSQISEGHLGHGAIYSVITAGRKSDC